MITQDKIVKHIIEGQPGPGRWSHPLCSIDKKIAYTVPFNKQVNENHEPVAVQYCEHCMSVYEEGREGPVSISGLK